MNPRTDVAGSGADDGKKPEFSPMFLRWIISLTIVTLLLAFFRDYVLWGHDVVFAPVPFIVAGGIVIRQGLELFQGHELAPIPLAQQISMLAGLLTAFVLAPTLLFFSWRRLVAEPKQSRMSPSSIGFVFGVILFSAGLLGTVVPAIVQPQVASSMRKAQDLAEHRDQVIAGLWRVQVDAYQYKILPGSYNGGGGSYKGYAVPVSLQKTTEAEFVLTAVADTSFTILASSAKYPGAGIEVTYNRQGKVAGYFKFMGSFE